MLALVGIVLGGALASYGANEFEQGRQILGVDVPGVQSRVHRARLFVRKRLSEEFESAAAA